MKGLIASILVDKQIGNCSNGGLSEGHDCVTIVDMGRDSEVFEVKPDRPAVKLVFRTIGSSRIVHAEPVEPVKPGHIGYMAGGSFITTSDSRLGEYLRSRGVDMYGAISLHDRQETQAEYDALSR